MYWFLWRAINLLFQVFSALILVYCLLSWFARPGSSVFRLYCGLGDVVEPLIRPFRRLTSGFTYRTGIDFAPWLALIGLNILRSAALLVLRMVFV